MSIQWSDDELHARADVAAGLVTVGAALAQVIEDALQPVLDGGPRGRVQSCLHGMDEAVKQGVPASGSIDLDHHSLICPMHPHLGILCDEEKCIESHARTYHKDDDPVARCFVCESPIPEDLVTPVFAVVQLHRAVPLWGSFTSGKIPAMRGEIWTYPVTFLCLEHAGSVDLPIRMAWPTNADNITPEDVPPPEDGD